MKRSNYLMALVATAFLSCVNDYNGSLYRQSALVAMQFRAGYNPAVTRGDMKGDAAAQALNNYFHVYGTKTVGDTVKTVYPNYVVEYNGTDGAGAASSTISNTKGWEYVGLTNYPNQIVHYWDFSASNFTFQAWSPSTGGATVDVTGNKTLKVSTPTPDDLSKLYVADLVSIDKSAVSSVNSYGGVVTFAFRSMSTKVRVGFYETISGYTVSNMTFRSMNNRFATSNSHALFEGSFNASDGTQGGDYDVTYNVTTGRAEVANTTVVTPVNYYDFGTFSQEPIAEDSANPTWAGGTAVYQNVLPNEDHVGDMSLYVDFTLTASDGSNDVIKVTGAHVTVPASYMVWHPNYAYTYLFKITKDVNGTTGEEGTDPEKLYPITFDALVAEDVEATGPVETEVKK